MADPISLAAISIGSSVVGTGLSAAGAASSASAQGQMYGYQAAVARLNQQIALQNADYARDQGEGQAQKYGMGARQQAGQIRAGQGASGLDVNSGSAKSVADSQHIVSRMDMDTIRANAAKTAYNYDVQAAQFGTQGKMYDSASANAKEAGAINVASSIVGGVGSVASKWLQGQTMGLWGGTAGSSANPGPDPLTEWSLGR